MITLKINLASQLNEVQHPSAYLPESFLYVLIFLDLGIVHLIACILVGHFIVELDYINGVRFGVWLELVLKSG